MVAMVRWDNTYKYILVSEGGGNAGSYDGSCEELLLMERDHGQGRARLQRVGLAAAAVSTPTVA
jgi:hypothetical protein